MFKECLQEWKDELFDENFHQRKEFDQLMTQDTRESKSQAKQAFRAAFKAYLKETIGRAQLGYMLLKHPLMEISTLLQEWQKYTDSKEYQEEKERSRRVSNKKSGSLYPATALDPTVEAQIQF